MLLYIFIGLFLLALVSSKIRDYLKRWLGGLYMVIGGIMGVLTLIMSFLVYPKLSLIANQVDAQVLGIEKIIYLAIAFLMNLGIFVIGWKYKNLLRRSDKVFYLAYILVVISVVISFILIINAVIAPIYKLTGSIS